MYKVFAANKIELFEFLSDVVISHVSVSFLLVITVTVNGQDILMLMWHVCAIFVGLHYAPLFLASDSDIDASVFFFPPPFLYSISSYLILCD